MWNSEMICDAVHQTQYQSFQRKINPKPHWGDPFSLRLIQFLRNPKQTKQKIGTKKNAKRNNIWLIPLSWQLDLNCLPTAGAHLFHGFFARKFYCVYLQCLYFFCLNLCDICFGRFIGLVCFCFCRILWIHTCFWSQGTRTKNHPDEILSHG